MIEQTLPLTKNKMEILKQIYINDKTHLQEISKKLKLHPYSVQKTLLTLEHFLEKNKHGKTITLNINKKMTGSKELLYIIEDYKTGTCNNKVKKIIKNIQIFFSADQNILSCCLFGSYARDAATEESDVDLLFVVKGQHDKILKGCRDISSVLGKEINPIIMDEKEFFAALAAKEPAIETILAPSQRYILIGKEYFLKNTIR